MAVRPPLTRAWSRNALLGVGKQAFRPSAVQPPAQAYREQQLGSECVCVCVLTQLKCDVRLLCVLRAAH